MTAAGTVRPARVLVIGAGVAGLQAIATSRRLGAVVSAFDVRAAARQEIQSLGATFITVDDEAGMGRRRLGNDEVLAAARENPEVLIPFASVDPHKGKLAVREIHELIDAGVRGFKFHPNTQAFWPNDRDHYRVYEPIAKAGLIALFHSGTTGIGAGMPGGGGVRLKYSNPMCVDDLAADFPDLRIILAHPSFPWQDEALAVAVHKPNVYIDLSGWSPKYFPENLIRYTNTQLRHKMLFGSDYPLITPDGFSDFTANGPAAAGILVVLLLPTGFAGLLHRVILSIAARRQRPGE